MRVIKWEIEIYMATSQRQVGKVAAKSEAANVVMYQGRII